MKTYKKIAAGFVLLAISLSFGIFLPKKALAYTPISAEQIRGATFEFQNRSTIIGNFGGNRAVFIDQDPQNDEYNYRIQDSVCFGEIDFNQRGATDISWGNPQSFTRVTGSVDIDFSGSGSGSNCQNVGQRNERILKDIGNAAVIYNYLRWQGNTLRAVPPATRFFDGALTPLRDNQNILLSDINSSCPEYVAVLSSDSSGKIFTLANTGGNQTRVTNFINTGQGDTRTSYRFSGDCRVVRVNFTSHGGSGRAMSEAEQARRYQELAKRSFSISGTRGTATTGGGAGSSATGGADDTCDLNSSGFSLGWIVCPLLNAGQDLTNVLLEEIEDQLSFTVAQDLGDPDSENKVRTTWSLIKNIATGALVIVMLIMVISQAIGGGPFDAYTVRKVFPRLVIAAVAMQLSWPLFAWVVEVFDIIGNSIQDFLFAPFGGRDNMGLGSLLSNAGWDAAATGVVSWIGLVGGLAIGLATLPTTLFLVTTAIVAVLVAYVVLILREILIIMLLILAPLALLAWILPGTQRYWKLWSDNFIKILAMFPLIMALIASGRIFAYVAGTQDNGAGGRLFSLTIIMVGFFGPLFLLPKTFKWGGALMAMGAGFANSVGQRGLKTLEEPVKAYGQRKQGEWANDYDSQDKKIGIGKSQIKIPFSKKSIPILALNGKVIRRIQSGHYMPTERSRRQTIARGDEWAAKQTDQATALVNNVAYNAFHKGFRDPETGKFVTDKDGNIIKGVQAQKLAMNEIAGNAYETDAEKRAARQAVHRMRETSSWIEFQSARVRSGPNEGRRIVELPAWRDQLVRDGSDYGAVTGSRPDLAPDVIEGAQKTVALRHKVDLGKMGMRDFNKFTGDHQTEIDEARLRSAIGRLKPGDVERVHFGFFEDVQRIADKETGFEPVLEQAKSDAKSNGINFEKEDEIALREQYLRANPDKKSALATQFGVQLKNFHDNGGYAGANAVSSLVGQDTKPKVDAVLQSSSTAGTQSINQIIGRGGAPSGGAAPAAPSTGTPPEDEGRTAPSTGGGPGDFGSGGGSAPAGSGSGSPGPGGLSPNRPPAGGSYSSPSAIEDAVYSGTARALRENSIRQAERERPITATPLPSGVLRIEHEPSYLPGDTVRPVEGASKGIVIPPGVRSADPETPSSVTTPSSPDFRPPSSSDLPR